MDRNEILQKFAPCSLMCHTCSAYDGGEICAAARKLLHYTDGMRGFYEKHMPDEVGEYDVFENVLRRYGAGGCPGCRSGRQTMCSIAGCFIPECTRAHGVDFCGECAEFPCERPKELFENEVYAQWLAGGREIAALGAEGFWEKYHTKPHYLAYKTAENADER